MNTCFSGTLGIALGVLLVNSAVAATNVDLDMLTKVTPIVPAENRSFPVGYEVVSLPSEDAIAIKQMPSGLAKVAAYLDVDGRRYFLSDWSYDRLKAGASYHWIRPLNTEQGTTTELIARKPRLRDTLRTWLPHKFLHAPTIMTHNGQECVAGIFSTGHGQMAVYFPIPPQLIGKDVDHPLLLDLPSSEAVITIGGGIPQLAFGSLYGEKNPRINEPYNWTYEERTRVIRVMKDRCQSSLDKILNHFADLPGRWSETDWPGADKDKYKIIGSGSIVALVEEVQPDFSEATDSYPDCARYHVHFHLRK